MQVDRPLIRAILENLLGKEDAARLEIVSNSVDVHSDGHFNVRFRHPDRLDYWHTEGDAV